MTYPEWRAGAACVTLDRTRIMGVVNATPDSFSDGGRLVDADAAVRHALRLVAEGADVIDVGGESTRPGAAPVDAAEETRRVVPVVERLAKESDVPISVDTTKAEVAEAALAAGAVVVNDVSAGTHDPDMLRVVARERAGLVLMHMRGTPRDMQDEPRYDDVVAEVRAHLVARADAAQALGIPRSHIVLDPGIGFGKTLRHNVELLRRLPEIADAGMPVLVGVSRKSFLGRITAVGGVEPPPDDRLEGTLAANALAIAGGASVLRVHDVKAAWRAARVADAIVGKRGGMPDG